MTKENDGPLDWDENPRALPYLDAHGELVIPMDLTKKFSVQDPPDGYGQGELFEVAKGAIGEPSNSIYCR